MTLSVACLCSCLTMRIDVEDPGSRPDKYYDTPVWSIAVSYPDDYDWMRDPLGGSMMSQILVFRDETPMLCLDASEEGPISPQADLHHIVDGHLYSNFASSDGVTRMFVDGQELFNFDGRETIDAMLVRDGNVYTLGCPIESGGWSFRKNGVLQYGQNEGRLLSGLYEDNSELCFSWASPIVSTSGETAWRYFTYFGGHRKQMELDSDITAVHCIRRKDGKTSRLSSSSVMKGILWEDEDGSICLAPYAGELHEATFLLIGGTLCARIIEMEDRNGEKLWHESYWTKNGKLVQTSDYRHACTISRDAPSLLVATCPTGHIDSIILWKDGIEYTLPEQLFMVSPNSHCCNEKYHFLGLNDGADAKKSPLLIHGSDTTRFNFNGYFTELSLP